MNQILGLLVVTFISDFALGANYEGYKLFKVVPEHLSQIEQLKLLERSDEIDFWSKPRSIGKSASVLVGPERHENFRSFLEKNRIRYGVEIDNLESVIRAERERYLAQPRVAKGKVTFDQFLRYDEINSYLAQLAEDYPDIVKLESIGRSYEGRDMVLIRISADDRPKPTIFVDAGIHAREWIAPSVAVYLISRLVENVGNRHLIEDVNWIILPLANPDGYEYSFTNDRLWRKTRTPGSRCDGVDANRNFGFHWMEAGASSRECAEDYAGPKAFSEIEARNLRDFLLNEPNLVLYLTLHSCGQYILYPWGYNTRLPRADNWQELEDLGEAVNSAISAVFGTEYSVGNSADLLYPAAGASDDWSKGEANIGLAYTIELPCGGRTGFDLPASEILKVCIETYEGLLVFHDHVARNKQLS